MLASARFQRWSKAFPATRPIARNRSRALFDLLAGFTYSQVLYVFVKLGLVGRLLAAPLAIRDIASAIQWDIPQTERLLKAAAALDLAEAVGGGRYALGAHGAALAGNPWIVKFILHHDLLYNDLADPVALLSGKLETTALGTFWSYARASAGGSGNDDYSDLMAHSQRAITEEILAAHDFGGYRSVLDVGGGDGSFLRALGTHYPEIMLNLFDLPAVVEIAKTRTTGNRSIAFHGGNFHKDELPRGADAVTLVRIAHDHDDAKVQALLARIRAALNPGGVLIIAEPLSGTRGTAPVTDAYFNSYFAAMGQGRTRTASEFAEMGRQAGFSSHRQISTRMPLLTGMVILTTT
jgi:demethylspheroidene O-methyltransferase